MRSYLVRFNSTTCLFPRSAFVLVLQNPQVSFNSPSISKSRCGQCYDLALGSWFLYQRHFRKQQQQQQQPAQQRQQQQHSTRSILWWMSRTSHRSRGIFLAVSRRSGRSVTRPWGLPFGRRLVSSISFHLFVCFLGWKWRYVFLVSYISSAVYPRLGGM